jgi:murein DD-endopeptidase MepM/ murein hydrolase activator NlpD
MYAPCDGVIVKAVDGYPERARAHVLTDTLIAFKNALAFNPAKDDIRTVAGNYLIMRCDPNVYAAFAHLKQGSIAVAVGQSVKKGDLLGKVGHSGNSTAPHLHFQLMDRADLRTAKGIPCAFERIELFQNGEWKTVSRAVPSREDRFRFLK